MQHAVREWFREVVSRPPEERFQWLQDSCPDVQVRAEVLSLLAYDRATDATLQRPIRATAAQLDPTSLIRPGLRLGAFELGGLLGQGGMGRVFEAYRVDDQVEQTVAIKVFDLAVANDAFREAATARFLRERQILASLQHPYIAALIDVGTIHGAPYFVMERVDGLPIDKFAQEYQLGIRGCIELVLKVCEAVERAHQNLIIHRDIKPGNILVTQTGTPKLLDFGIAKELFGTTGTETVVAAFTPEYASPEQFGGRSVAVATDVYGLGGLLYRLLTGQAPHAVRGSSSADWLRIILETDVPAPASLRPELRGDLDNILRKALHREPDRRYESARAFADDLRAFLEYRPVRATPDSFAYRVRTCLRRNKLLTAVATIGVVSLIGGTAASLYQARRAQQRFDQVRQLANVFLFDFERAIRDTPGTLAARNLVASTGHRYLKQLAAESRNDPSLERELAEAYERLADIQGALQAGGGKSPAETDSLRQSLEIRRRLGDHESKIPWLRRKYIELASRIGYQFQDGKNAGGAVRWAEEAMRLSEQWVSAEPRSADALAASTAAFMRAATTQEVAGEIDKARVSLEKAVAFGELAMAVAPNDQPIRILVSGASRIYSELLHTLKRYPAALTHSLRSLELIEPLWKQRPADLSLRANFINSNSAVGIAERALGDQDPNHFAAALRYLRRSYELARESMLADRQHTRNKSSFVIHTHRLCSLLIAMKKFDEAAALYEKSGEVTRDLAASDPANRRSWYMLGKNNLDLGWLFLESHRPARAREAFVASNEGFEQALALDPKDAVVLECRTSQFEGLARAALQSRNQAEARSWIRRCLDLMRTMVARDPSAKDYIFDFAGKLSLAQQLSVSTDGLD